MPNYNCVLIETNGDVRAVEGDFSYVANQPDDPSLGVLIGSHHVVFGNNGAVGEFSAEIDRDVIVLYGKDNEGEEDNDLASYFSDPRTVYGKALVVGCGRNDLYEPLTLAEVKAAIAYLEEWFGAEDVTGW